MPETEKLEFIREIGFTHMRISGTVQYVVKNKNYCVVLQKEVEKIKGCGSRSRSRSKIEQNRRKEKERKE